MYVISKQIIHIVYCYDLYGLVYEDDKVEFIHRIRFQDSVPTTLYKNSVVIMILNINTHLIKYKSHNFGTE